MINILITSDYKRTHNVCPIRPTPRFSLIPVVVALCLMLGIIPGLIPILIGIAGCVFLFKDAGEEGVNEHGSNPTQSYAEQISLENIG